MRRFVIQERLRFACCVMSPLATPAFFQPAGPLLKSPLWSHVSKNAHASAKLAPHFWMASLEVWHKGLLRASPLARLARVQLLTSVLVDCLPCPQPFLLIFGRLRLSLQAGVCLTFLGLPGSPASAAASDALHGGASACTASAAVTACDLVQKPHISSARFGPHSAPAFALCYSQLCLCRPRFRTLWLAALTT